MSEYKFWVVKNGQLHLFRNPQEDFEPDSSEMEWGELLDIHFHDDEKTTWKNLQGDEEKEEEEEERCSKCGKRLNDSELTEEICGPGCDEYDKGLLETREEEDCVYNFYICHHCFAECYDEKEVDCEHCGRKRCIFTYQAKNKSEAMREAMEKEEEKKEESETKNIKGNRKIVRVDYHCDGFFKIPDGLDLDDETVVESWGVKYNTLYINYVDGRLEQKDPVYDIEPDWKYPDNCEIDDAEPWNIEYSEDEEKEEKNSCKCGDRVRNPDDICAHGFADGICCVCDLCHKEGTK